MNERKRRWRPLAVSVGLGAAGVVAVLAAAWFLPADLADVGPGRGWTRAFAVAIVVASAAVVWLRPRRLAAPAWVLAGAGLGVTVLAVVGFVAQYRSGFPGLCTLLAAIGGAAVTVGALLSLLAPAGRWRVPPPRSALSAVGALLLVLVIAVPMLLVAPDWRLSATNGVRGEPMALPDTVTKVAWSADLDGQITDVVAGGAGAIVMLADGVVAVDGTTGEIRWSRHRAGAEAEQIDVSPDGRTVMLQISPADRFPIRREVLDAFTGELRFADDSPNDARSPGFLVPMTNVSYIKANPDRTEFYGDSLTDGTRLWTFRAPDGCRIIGSNSQQFARGNGMLLPLVCGDREFRFVSVDAATGGLRWQHVVPLAEPSRNPQFTIDHGLDHALAQLNVPNAANPQPAVLDTDTGAVLPAPSPLDLKNRGVGVAGRPGSSTLIDVRTGRVLAAEGPVFFCAGDAGYALLASGAVCVDQRGKPFDEFTTTGTVKLAIARFAEQTLTSVPVQLGGPFVEHGSGELFKSRTVPGAVVVYSGLSPANGHKSRITGLR
jgi:hypothetical protein